MKTLLNNFPVITLLVLFWGSTLVSSVYGQEAEQVTGAQSFEVGILVKPAEKLLLLIKVKETPAVRVKLYGNKNQLLYEEFLRKDERAYARRFNFAGAASGTYRFEIVAGREKIIREVQLQIPKLVEPTRSIAFIQ